MAEESQPTSATETKPVAEIGVKVEAAEVEQTYAEDSAKPESDCADPGECEAEVGSGAAVAASVSFKEESNLVSDLSNAERKALEELKELVLAAIANGEFSLPSPPLPPSSNPLGSNSSVENTEIAEPEEKTVEVEAAEEAVGDEAVEDGEVAPTEKDASPPVKEELLIWGVPLVGDHRSDTVLLKFLRAREFKPKEAMAMLKSTVLWRKHFGIEKLLEDEGDLGLPEMDNVVFTSGVDREGHPVCYNVYGEFQNKDLYEKAFGDEKRRLSFLKWRIRYLEKGIRCQLDFSPGGVCSFVQVTDLKNSPPVLGKHRLVTRQALALLQDNYPEFIAKKVFINVPWWYIAVNRIINPFLTQRTKSKLVSAGPSKSAEILFKYIAPEQVPVQFGGLRDDANSDFMTSDAATELTVKPASKQTIDIPATENCTITWELRVAGYEVNYGAEFSPTSTGGYTVIVQKTRKLAVTDDEPVVKGTFKAGEPGKLVLTVDNPTSKPRLVVYRFKYQDLL